MLDYSSTEKWTLVATILASSLAYIDSSALNVALPALQTDLELTGSQLMWVVNSYALFLSALLLLGGAMGDQYGRVKIFGLGLIIFMLSSFACGLSQNAAQLITARTFQGTGGALLIPGSLSIITARFSTAKVGSAIGIWSTFSAMTTITGPVLGGWLAGLGLWRVIFFLNIPFSLFVIWIIYNKVPESKNSEIRKLDYWGAFLATTGLAGITYGFLESANRGFGDQIIMVSISVGLIASMGFIFSQYLGKYPMMPLRLFSAVHFRIANLGTLFVYGGLTTILLFLPLNLVQVQGYSPGTVGLSLLPSITLITLLSTFAGRMSDHLGPRLFLSVGPLITGFAFFLYGFQGITNGPSDYWSSFFIPTVLLGLGMGLTVAPLTTTVMRSVSKDNSGIASGVNNTVARMSGVLSIALMGAMALAYFKTDLIGQALDLNLSHEIIAALEADAINLGSTKPPADVPANIADQIQLSIKSAFIKSFNAVAYISAIAAWLTALLSFLFLKTPKAATVSDEYKLSQNNLNPPDGIKK